MPNRFCAICGKKLDTRAPHFGMCLKCYLNDNPLFEIPKRFSLNICIDCGSYSKKDIWIESSKNELFSIIDEAIKNYMLKPILKKRGIEFSLSFDENSFIYSSKDLLKSLEVIVVGFLREDFNVKHQQIVKLNLDYTLCKNCTNLRGGTYYVSIIQLRVKNESQFDLIKNALDQINNHVDLIFVKDHKQYISKIEDQKHGVDLYLSTNELMNYIIKFLKGKYQFLLKRTKKLVGRDSQKGRNLYRLKALIKFLPVSKNDEVLIDNQNYIVENITKNKIILRSKNNTKLIKDYSYFFNEKTIKKNY